VELGPDDFARLRAWGFNAQVIRLESCRLGASPECRVDPAYLDKLDRWTTEAARHGIYTIYKMTTYDAPSWGVGAAFAEERWQQFWDNEGGQQEVHIRGWTEVWRRFTGRPEVVGYDILNEPHLGSRTRPFHRDHLFPYYRKASKAMRSIDSEAVLLFQPGPRVALEEAPEPLDDPNALFAPHFYPRQLDVYEDRMNTMLDLAARARYAIAFPEYGYPDHPFRDILPAWTPEVGRATAVLFDRHGLSTMRPWYVHSPYWSVLQSDGTEHKEKMDIVSRPYPQRLAGSTTGWSFDFDSKVFVLEIEPRQLSEARGGVDAAGVARAATSSRADAGPGSEIFVAARRHYPNGFRLTLDGETLAWDPAQRGSLTPGDRARDVGAVFDADAEILALEPRSSRRALRIQPR
jgi:endoglycosylceramidase